MKTTLDFNDPAAHNSKIPLNRGAIRHMALFGDETDLKRRFGGFVLLLAVIYGGVWVFYANPAFSGTRLAKEIFVWPLTLGLLWLYWQGFQLTQQGKIPRWLLVSGAIVLAVIAAMIPPFHSTDLYGYINRGWQQWHYHLNPYVYTVAQTPGWEHDPMITDHWVNNPSPYGFAYLLLAKGLCALGDGQKAFTILVFKAFNVLVHLGTALLVWLGANKLTEKFNNTGERQANFFQWADTALYLYAFSPLILMHGLANGHNDMMMGFFITLTAFFAIIGSWLFLLPALMLATLVKYGAVVLIPPTLLFLIKQKRWGALIGGSVLAALVFFGTGIPYLGEWSSFHLKEINENAFVSHGSIHSFFLSFSKAIASAVWPWVSSLNQWSHTVAEEQLLAFKQLLRSSFKNTLLCCFVLFYGWLGVSRLRQAVYSLAEWLQDFLLIMASLVCLVSLKFYPWYFGMFFPLAFYLQPGHWLRRVVVGVSGAQLFALTFIGQAHLLNFWIMTGLPLLWLCGAMEPLKTSLKKMLNRSHQNVTEGSL